jgi:hypothetical protein
VDQRELGPPDDQAGEGGIHLEFRFPEGITDDAQSLALTDPVTRIDVGPEDAAAWRSYPAGAAGDHGLEPASR